MKKFSLITRNLVVFLPFAVPGVVYASEKPKIDDCNDPVCDDKKENLFKSLKRRHSKVLLNKRIACPLSKSQYGKSTWEFLHTTAAYYPDEPTKTDRKSATNLIDSVKQLYACKSCREHIKNVLEEEVVTIDVSTREKFQNSVCKLHNEVNEILGKPIFKCTEEALVQRWRKGDEKCRSKEKIN